MERAHAAALALRQQGHLLPPTIKLVLLVNAYLDERYQGVPLARAHNQRLVLRRALDEALGKFDLLLAPTITRVAVPLPSGRLTPVEAMSRIVSETTLSAPANVTGHPALALPSGLMAMGCRRRRSSSAALRRAAPPRRRRRRGVGARPPDPHLMHIGVNLNNREALIAPDYGVPELLDLGTRAEELGFDSVWVGDSLLSKPRYEPLRCSPHSPNGRAACSSARPAS